MFPIAYAYPKKSVQYVTCSDDGFSLSDSAPNFPFSFKIPLAAGAGLSWVSVEMLRIMHYHPQQKNFPDLQIYFFFQFCNQFF